METAEGLRHVFVTVVCFDADYLQTSKSSHSLNHADEAPCNVCGLRRGPEGTIRHTSINGSAHLSSMLNEEHISAFLENDPSDDDLKFVCLKKDVRKTAHAFYQEVYRECTNTHFERSKHTCYNGLRLLSQCSADGKTFGYCICNMPGPYHLAFLGVGKDVLSFIFEMLTSIGRGMFGDKLVQASKEVGLTAPTRVTKVKKNSGGHVTYIGVSELAAFLLVAPAALSTVDGSGNAIHESCWEILTSINNIIAISYYTPSRSLIQSMKQTRGVEVLVSSQIMLLHTLL